eukprot:UN2963
MGLYRCCPSCRRLARCKVCAQGASSLPASRTYPIGFPWWIYGSCGRSRLDATAMSPRLAPRCCWANERQSRGILIFLCWLICFRARLHKAVEVTGGLATKLR